MPGSGHLPCRRRAGGWHRSGSGGGNVGGRYYGLSVPRGQDRRFVTGQGQYLDNLAVPGTLHAVVVRCPFAHARIVSVNTALALSVSGVVGAFGGEDLRADWGAPLPMMWPVTDEVRIPDRWPPSPDVARFAGDGVAVVLARTPAAAKDAAEAVLVEYDPIPSRTWRRHRAPTPPWSIPTSARTCATASRYRPETPRRCSGSRPPFAARDPAVFDRDSVSVRSRPIGTARQR